MLTRYRSATSRDHGRFDADVGLPAAKCSRPPPHVGEEPVQVDQERVAEHGFGAADAGPA